MAMPTDRWTFIINDPHGGCDPLRLVVMAETERAAKRLAKLAGYRVPRGYKALPIVPEDASSLVGSAPGMVFWRIEAAEGVTAWQSVRPSS